MSTIDVRVYYEDTDAGGVVYHANHIKFFERGRTEWLRQLGWEQDKLLEQDLVFVVRSLDIHYRLPAKFNQLLQVETTVKQVKRASIVFNQRILHEQNVIAEGTVTVASVKLSTMKAGALPEQLKEELSVGS